MLTAVIRNHDKKSKKTLSVSTFGKIYLTEVGEKVPSRRLNRILREFKGHYVASSDLKLEPSTAINTDNAKKQLLFLQFAYYILAQNGKDLSVGIIDNEMDLIPSHLTETIVAHCSEVVFCSDGYCDNICRELLLKTGICPECVTDRRHLMQLDAVFSFSGFEGYSGLLFGNGSRQIDRNLIFIPEPYRQLLGFGIDNVELWCALYSEGLVFESEKFTVI